ncbi:MAG: GWxTD domain-containing protein [Gracilimonas sp.]|uniref:GWxTD domain-containing protein n=1 Tax=Gracilimonas sp. TaxID=1974203 RepID=UPI0019A313A8|nr:GWxTD domain-containing protein [Gracilimonas sp.]MBD3615622.1 GWxTD domain-containing protein [Gracilimonas sp.]
MSKQILILLLFLGFSTSLLAQRVSYPQLVMRSQNPTIFIDDIILPGEDGKTTLAFIFRFDNDFIPYKKIPSNHSMDVPEGAEFYSTIRLNTEVFEGKLKRRQEPSTTSVARDSWADTVFTSSFEETQSKDLYASGALSIQLAPRTYNFILQLSMMQEVNERSTQRRNVSVPDLSTKKTGEIILIKEQSSKDDNQILHLMNMESNVPFGKDFQALIRIPDYDPSINYSLKVNDANTSRNDTTAGETVYTADLSKSNIYTASTIKLNKQKYPSLTLMEGNYPYTYAVVSIPASRFKNAPYFLSLLKNESSEPIARTFFRSYWPDMPASLYNLNISIEMLKYIVSDEEIARIKKGNVSEREQKFREFWESRDPTPNTVYNELMAEYYRRIDYAFKEFGSEENPMGHENDQGEIYIKFGPPNEKERIFPPGEKTREIWKYPNRTFVFEAGSGFGDFILVGSR